MCTPCKIQAGSIGVAIQEEEEEEKSTKLFK
jgi:hypothetical protein